MPSNPQNKGNIHLNSGQIHCFSKIHSKNNILPKRRNHAESEQNGQNLHIILHTKIKKSFFVFYINFL